MLLPAGLSFLLAFGTDIAIPMVTISAYMDLVLAMTFWIGVVFELPLIMFLLAKLRLVEYRHWKRFRRYVPTGAGVLGVIITPSGDPLNALLVATPIVLLYEVGMLLSWLARPRAKSGASP